MPFFIAIRLVQNFHADVDVYKRQNMCFTNIGDNETIRTVIKDGFKIHNGHPTFDKTWTDPINAKQFAAELVKHNYREGWRLPDMPR